MFNVRAYRLLGLIGLWAGTAAANSLSINLPLVDGVPTLTGTAGQVTVVDGTIFVDSPPLVLDDLSVTETSIQGVSVSVSPLVYSTDTSNPFFAAENPGGIGLLVNTTGELVTVTFPTVSAESITKVSYSLAYDGASSPFTGYFLVLDEPPPSAPEPASFAMMGLALTLAIVYLSRRERPSCEETSSSDTSSSDPIETS